jgi:hypothetical protein
MWMSDAGDAIIAAIEKRIAADPNREIRVRMPSERFGGSYIDPEDHKIVLVFFQPKDEPVSCPCCGREFDETKTS